MGKQLQAYLYEHIPITKAMGVQVEHASLDKVVLWAPLRENINHKSTVFGGSLHAALTLACWCMVYMHVRHMHVHHLHPQIVITKSEASYRVPVDGDFRAKCDAPPMHEWQKFQNMLQTKGKGRIPLTATIVHNSQVAVEY